jgi:hypothetical protein
LDDRQTSVAAEYLALNFSPGVALIVVLDATNVTEVAAPIQAKSMRSPAARPSKLSMVTETAPEVVSIVMSLPLSDEVGVSLAPVTERRI